MNTSESGQVVQLPQAPLRRRSSLGRLASLSLRASEGAMLLTCFDRSGKRSETVGVHRLSLPDAIIARQRTPGIFRRWKIGCDVLAKWQQ